MAEIIGFIVLTAFLVITGNAVFNVLMGAKGKYEAFGFLGCVPCPTTPIPSVAEENCLLDWSRVTRIAFRKSIAASDTIVSWQDQSVWIGWIAGPAAPNEDQKVTLTPRGKLKSFGISQTPPVRTTDTPSGTERVLGKVTQDKVTFMLENISPAQYESLLNLFCHELEVVFATAENTAILKVDPLNAPELRGFKTFGKIVIDGPVINPELRLQPKNFMVEFTFDDLYWYAISREISVPFINTL